MTTNQKELIRQLNENQNIIKELTFCDNCKNQHSCYIFSVFSMIGMSFSYCAAGIPMKPAEFEKFHALMNELSETASANQNLLESAESMIRWQNRILKHKTYCTDCGNCGCCDAEDVMRSKNIDNPYCCVGCKKET